MNAKKSKLILVLGLALFIGQGILAQPRADVQKENKQNKAESNKQAKQDKQSVGVDSQKDVEDSHIYQNIFQNVYYLIQNYYVDPITRKRLLEGAVRGLLEATEDPYSRFLNHEEHKDFNRSEEGNLVGIGIEVALQSGFPLIIAPIPGGPAERAGLQSGDRIIKINGKATRYVGMSKLAEMITGESGTIVELDILRMGKVSTVRLERGVVQLEYVKSSLLENDKIGYLRLQAFFGEDAGSIDKFKAALLDFRDRGLKSIIIDLRNNSGGHVEMARILSGFFLQKGQVVYRVKSRTESKEFFADGGDVVSPNAKVFILINKGSASASEILSGCLQDYGRAVLIGEQSFGKASVQQVFRPLADDTAVLITTQRYYTPKNRSLHGIGLKPDIIVADVTPDAQEAVYLTTMEKQKVMEKWIETNPEFNDELVEKFHTSVAKQGFTLRKELVRAMLRREYGVRKPDPDVKSDPQLARAILEATR